MKFILPLFVLSFHCILAQTDISSEEVSQKFVVYPTVTDSSVQIKPNPTPETTVKVYNEEGTTVEAPLQSDRIDLSNLPAGEYYIRLDAFDTQMMQKVVKN